MPQPEMKPVKSSNIVKMGHDEANKVLYVEFPGKVVWTYQLVTKDIYDEMLKSGSIGAFFHRNIRMNAVHKAEKYVAQPQEAKLV